MKGTDWSLLEVEALVDDYLEMLASELAGVAYNKAARLRLLAPRLQGRSAGSIEFKRANVSAALLDMGFPYIAGYKPRMNYQQRLADVVDERLSRNGRLLDVAAADADRPMIVPYVDDMLGILTDAPHGSVIEPPLREPIIRARNLTTNYIEREARNRSLGSAGEEFVLEYERTRLIRAGHERLASRIEHTAVVRGDHEGYDILSFDTDGAERLIEVKTTKYGQQTPFFVTKNEVNVSVRHAMHYHVYRMFSFSQSPRLYMLHGAIPERCHLAPATYLALPR
jgi:hypothetical protein